MDAHAVIERELAPGQKLQLLTEVAVLDDDLAVVLPAGTVVEYVKPILLQCKLIDGDLVNIRIDVLGFFEDPEC